MERQPITDEAIVRAFGDTGDFVARDVEAAGRRLRVYFIDGLTSGGNISDFVIRPLSMALTGGSMAELLERARTGTVYNAVAEPVDSLDGVLSKLVNGFTVVL